MTNTKSIMKEEKKDQLYLELMQAIINKQKEILGLDVAIGRAKKVEDLQISIDGKIEKVNGYYEASLQSLINEYFKLTTQAGLEICINVIKEHLKKNVELELPREIEVLLKS